MMFFIILTSYQSRKKNRDPRQFVGSINRAHLYPRIYRPPRHGTEWVEVLAEKGWVIGFIGNPYEMDYIDDDSITWG